MKNLEIINLDVFTDERGWLAEILRSEHMVHKKEFGQIHVTTAYPSYAKGNHYHSRKYEWFCVVKGTGLLVLEDLTTGERKEILMGDRNRVTVRIPPGVAHGIKNIGEDMMFLIVYNEETFDPKDPDTFARKVV